MFLHLSIILFRGRGVCPSMRHRSHDKGGLCPRGSLSGRPPWTETPWTETPGQRPPWTETPQTETPWTETTLDRDPPDRDSLDRDHPGQRPPCTVTGGRYASYWNAFLLVKCFSLFYSPYVWYIGEAIYHRHALSTSHFDP